MEWLDYMRSTGAAALFLVGGFTLLSVRADVYLLAQSGDSYKELLQQSIAERNAPQSPANGTDKIDAETIERLSGDKSLLERARDIQATIKVSIYIFMAAFALAALDRYILRRPKPASKDKRTP